MKFTIVGHACLFIETGKETILVDPWLSGSCYWRSWWHFPPNTADEFLNPDYIYLSHHHFDHFHYPSLRRISRTAKVLIPRFGVDVMRFELANLGFTDVTELEHGDVTRLATGTRLASYQYGPDDSALVVERNGVVLADLNDCKISGASVRPLLRAFGNPTFFFKSHSFAQAYPNCYNFEDEGDAKYMTREDFVTTFINEVREMRPKYAVPFASMVAFLHPESRQCNRYAVRPPEVVSAANASDTAKATEAVLMIPGDTWDSASGFAIQSTDYYATREAWIDRLAFENEAKIAESERADSAIRIPFEQFETFFNGFLRSLPPLIGLMMKRPISFFVASDDKPFWVLDFRTRRVRRESVAPADAASTIRMNEAMLADAMAKNVVGFTHISMRIRIDLAAGGAPGDLLFWGLMAIAELGYLPLHKMLTPRAVRVLWLRRAEVLSMLRSMAGFQSLHKNMLRHLKSLSTQNRKFLRGAR
jgi:UDP-MurNAc hydroxylase